MKQSSRHIAFEPVSLSVELDALLAELLDARWPAAHFARRIRSRDNLSAVLAQYTQRLLPGEDWRAYSDGVRLLFVIAHEASAFSDNPATRALELRFFEADGTLCASGIWQHREGMDWRFVHSEPRPDRPLTPCVHCELRRLARWEKDTAN